MQSRDNIEAISSKVDSSTTGEVNPKIEPYYYNPSWSSFHVDVILAEPTERNFSKIRRLAKCSNIERRRDGIIFRCVSRTEALKVALSMLRSNLGLVNLREEHNHSLT